MSSRTNFSLPQRCLLGTAPNAAPRWTQDARCRSASPRTARGQHLASPRSPGKVALCLLGCRQHSSSLKQPLWPRGCDALRSKVTAGTWACSQHLSRTPQESGGRHMVIKASKCRLTGMRPRASPWEEHFPLSKHELHAQKCAAIPERSSNAPNEDGCFRPVGLVTETRTAA